MKYRKLSRPFRLCSVGAWDADAGSLWNKRIKGQTCATNSSPVVSPVILTRRRVHHRPGLRGRRATVRACIDSAGSWKHFCVYAANWNRLFEGCEQSWRMSTFDRPDVPPARFDFSQIAWIIISGVRRSPSLPVRSRLFLVRWLFRLGSDNCLKCHWCECCETFFGRSSGVSNGLLLFTGEIKIKNVNWFFKQIKFIKNSTRPFDVGPLR